MNIDEFNKNFPSFEKQCKTLNEHQQKISQEILQNIQIAQLSNCFPDVSWNNLQKQNTNIMTNDMCIHYLDTTTNLIYSWNFYFENWYQKNQKDLIKLFII